MNPRSSRAPLFDRLQNFSDDVDAWPGPEVAFSVNADADGVRFQVAVADDDMVCFHLLGVAIFALMWLC